MLVEIDGISAFDKGLFEYACCLLSKYSNRITFQRNALKDSLFCHPSFIQNCFLKPTHLNIPTTV